MLFHIKTRVGLKYFVNDCRLIRISKFDVDVQFFSFGPEISFLGKFGSKNENCRFKIKVVIYTNLNILNLIVFFICPALNMKYPFWENLI